MSKTPNRRIAFAAAFFCLFLFSCPFVTLTELNVTVYPDDYGQVLSAGESVRIVFSSAVDHKSAEDAFSVRGAGTTVEGHLEWNALEARFVPDVPLLPKTAYTFSLSGQIYSSDKVFEYKKDMVVVFYYLDNSPRVTLIENETVPAHRASAGVDTTLEFHFSAPVNPLKLHSGLILTPAFEYTPVWNALNTQVTLTPDKNLDPAKIYTWKISTAFLDDDQVPLSREAEGWFSTTNDSVRPAVVICAPADPLLYSPYLAGPLADWSQMQKKTPLLVRFSEDMNTDSILNAVSISPAVTGNWSPNGTADFLFFPSTGWKMNQEYTLKIAPSASDLTGLGLAQEYKLLFTAQGIPAQTIVSIYANNGTSNEIPASTWNQTNLASVTDLDLPVSDPFVIITTVTFGQSYDLASRPVITSAISFSHVFPDDDDAANPLLEQVTWDASGSSVSLTWSTFTPSTPAIRRFYKFMIKGTEALTSNAAGSFLDEDTWFYFEATTP
jgi:hypothetical protein